MPFFFLIVFFFATHTFPSRTLLSSLWFFFSRSRTFFFFEVTCSFFSQLGIDNCVGHEVCVNNRWTKPGFICTCDRPGYTRDANGTCVDINECNQVPALCEQICINSNGTYACDCNPGYLLTASGGCVGEFPFLLF